MNESFHNIESIDYPRKVYGFGGYANFSVHENDYSPKSALAKKVYYRDEYVGHTITVEKLKSVTYRDDDGTQYCVLEYDDDAEETGTISIPYKDKNTLCDVGERYPCNSIELGFGTLDPDYDCERVCSRVKRYGTNDWAPQIDLYLWNANPNVEYEVLAQWGGFMTGYKKVDGACEPYATFTGEQRCKITFSIDPDEWIESERREIIVNGVKQRVEYRSPNVVRLTIGEAYQWSNDDHSHIMLQVGYKGTLQYKEYSEDWWSPLHGNF